MDLYNPAECKMMTAQDDYDAVWMRIPAPDSFPNPKAYLYKAYLCDVCGQTIEGDEVWLCLDSLALCCISCAQLQH